MCSHMSLHFRICSPIYIYIYIPIQLFLIDSEQSPDPDFELPLIERPRGAVSISHDLHRFEPKDYQDAWGETDAVATPPHSSSLKEKKLSEIDFIHQHQDTMRKALDSMNKNTQLIFKQLNSSTKSQS